MEANIMPQSVPPDTGQAGEFTLPSQYFGEAEKDKIVEEVEDYWFAGDANINNQNIMVNEEMDVSHSVGKKERIIVPHRKFLSLSNSVVIGSTKKSTVTSEASPTLIFPFETQSKVIRLLANDKENYSKIARKRHQASSFSASKKFAMDVSKNENRFTILDDENDQDNPTLKPNDSAAYNRNNTTNTPAGSSKNFHSNHNSSCNRINNSSNLQDNLKQVVSPYIYKGYIFKNNYGYCT